MHQRWYQGVTRGQWMALAAALLGWMFDGFEMGIFPAVARPALIDVLDLTEDDKQARTSTDKTTKDAAKKRVDQTVGLWNGRIYAAFLFGAALGGWFFGWLGDRIGRVRAMMLSVMTYAVFTGLCGLAQDAWQLAALRFIAALGMGGEWALGVALVMESWAPHARPVLAGLIGAAANVGFILAALLTMGLEGVGLRMSDGGWRWALGICTFPALLTFFIRMFVPESEKWILAVKTGPKPRLPDIFTPAIRYRTLMGATLGAIALVGTWASVQWITPWVSKESGGSTFMAALAQMSSGVGACFGAFFGAVLGHRLGRRFAYFSLALGSLITCAMLFRLDHHIPTAPVGWGDVNWGLLGLIFLVGGITASFYGWLPLYLPELFPTRLRATGQGFSFNSGRIIAAVGALVMGILMEQVFEGRYNEAAAAMSLVYVLGLIVIWWAPETHGQPLPE
jgi:MFS family permease